MKVIILPGLDGAADLLTPFAAALAPYEAQVLPYPESLGEFSELFEYVVESLAMLQGPFVLVAESFGGPLAVAVASKIEEVEGVVLFSSFLSSPPTALRFLLESFVSQSTIRLLLSNFSIRNILLRLLLGPDKADLKRYGKAVGRNIARLPAAVVTSRVESCCELEAHLAEQLGETAPVDPWLFVTARTDMLIPRIMQIVGIPSLRINGPHLLLETRPEHCAQVMKDELQLRGYPGS